jgi:hypothetical protein
MKSVNFFPSVLFRQPRPQREIECNIIMLTPRHYAILSFGLKSKKIEQAFVHKSRKNYKKEYVFED